RARLGGGSISGASCVHPQGRAPMFSFFRRRKEADATARRIINQGRFLGAHTPREAAANAVVLLTTAIVKKTISTIADDDDRFVAGIFVFVFSDYFTLVLPGNFEEASTLVMMKVLGIEEFHRGFDTIQESYNELVRSRP